MSDESIEPSHAPARGYGLPTATFIVVSSMVGAGVLTTSGFTVYDTHSNALMLCLWVVGGVLAICGALTIAELAASLPRSGGDYVFLREAFGPLPAFLSGWVSYLIGFGGPIAVAATAFARYLLDPLKLDANIAWYAVRGLATIAILFTAFVHAAGHKPSAQVQSTSTTLKLAVLALLALIGIAAGWRHWHNVVDWPPVGEVRWSLALSSLIYVSYAYTGWNGAGYVAGEVKDPQRLVPRAILWGTGLVTVLYLALNLFYALALSADDVRLIAEPLDKPKNVENVAPIAWLASERLFGRGFATWLSVAVGVTFVASLSAYVLTGARVVYAMAEAGQFPAFAGALRHGTGTPARAVWIQVIWSIGLLWLAPFDSILSYSSVGLALISMLTVCAIFVIRRRTDLPRPFKVPLYPLEPLVYLVGTGVLTAAAFWSKWRESSLALASILLGVPAYYAWIWWQRRAAIKP